MGAYDGLAVPINGGYTAYESTGATAYLTVNSDGTHDFTFSQEAADNLFSFTVTEGSVITSGYCQVIYISHTTSSTANISTGSAQINSIAVDLSLGGTIACEVEGMYVYVAASGTPTVTGANIAGYVAYLTDMGGSPSAQSCIQLHKNTTNLGSAADAFIYCRNEDSGNTTNVIQFQGTNNPTNFLACNGAGNMVATGDFVSSATSTYGLKVLIGSTTYYIPLVVNS